LKAISSLAKDENEKKRPDPAIAARVKGMSGLALPPDNCKSRLRR
jgi:hypothetical protein